MLLTRRTFFLLLLNALILAGATFAPALMYLAVVYVCVILGMILIDRQITPALKDFELTRTNDPRLSLGAENLVIVRVTNRGRRAVRAIVRDEFPVQFHADQTILNDARPSLLAPRAQVELRYHIRPPRRGDYRFGDLNLRWRGVLGLIVRQARFPASADVKVYPNLLDIRKYELLVRKGQLNEMGLRQTRWLGSGTQFERLREYQFDDEFRKIDWKATARRGKPISREFETERSQNIIALIDVGRLMRSPVGDPSAGSGQSLEKVDYAVNAALMLSYVAGLRGDKVGLLTFADQVINYLPPKAGKGQFYRMLATLYGIESQSVEADYVRAFAYLKAKHKKRALIVLFTDLASGLAAQTLVTQIAPLWPRHLPLLVAIGDPGVVELARRMPADSPSVYERMVAEQLLDERVVTMESLRRRGVLTLDVPANQLTIAVVNRYLELKAVGRI